MTNRDPYVPAGLSKACSDDPATCEFIVHTDFFCTLMA